MECKCKGEVGYDYMVDEYILYKLSKNLWLSQIILILLHRFNGVLK